MLEQPYTISGQNNKSNMDKIVKSPNKQLHLRSSKVISFREAKEIVDSLIVVTKKVDKPWSFWLGMVAPQIGFNKRIIILRKNYHTYTVMINPEIIERKWSFPIFSRCFSVDGIYIVNCPYWVKVKFQDLQGEFHTEVALGGKAATLQQEIDHVNGILISDKGVRII